MLTANVDVSDGLVNGARGEVTHIVTNSDRRVTMILVKFDNPSVGQSVLQSSVHRLAYPDSVPIKKHEATFLAMGKKGSEVTRFQFPLTLAWATTIHKVQGLTLDRIVVDMEGAKRFSPGQAYVAFSRVKSLRGLYLLNFDKACIKSSRKVCEEMVRLNTKLLSTSSPQFHGLCNTHVTCALLNVRCLCAKLGDLQKVTCSSWYM